MNGDLEGIKRELAALCPRAVSPALESRIGNRLTASSMARGGSWHWRLIQGAGLAAAACLLIALWWRGDKPADRPEPEVLPPHQPLAAQVPFDQGRPTLLAYYRAAAESPDALDTLLDKHSVAYGGSGLPISPLAGLSIFHALNWTGEPR